ncbi:MAG: LysM peptidoglycan-binding domain-containing protein [Planctomycetes bacterium]|nr:LysM peptidoglycan-binding domain-containing protein [Planctomycetota bacterium]
MGTGVFERLGLLFIIILAVVIFVIVGWGFGAPVDETVTDPGPIRDLSARGEEEAGPARPVARKQPAPNPWPEPDDEKGAVAQKGTGSSEEPVVEVKVQPAPIPSPVPPPPSRDLEHLVVKKDTLYSIAAKYYGDGKLWRVIVQANPDVDPKDLTVGLTLRIPDPERVLSRDAPDRTPAPIPAAANVYVVQKGDSLWKIAEKTLGSGVHHKKILDANLDVLEGNGENLQAGMRLKIPR